MKKISFFVLSAILLISLTSSLGVARSDSTLQNIHIALDGTITPASAPIQRNGDTYTFIDDICGTIVVEKEGIVLDGAGHTLYGLYNGTRTDTWEVGKGPDQALSNGTLWTIGIDFHVAYRPNNLTVKNLNIKDFYIGIYLWTSHNTLIRSSVTDNIVGVLLSGDSNNILENYIARNDQGIFFGVNNPGNEPLNIIMVHNSFIDNNVQFSGCFCGDYNTEENMHTWDDGQKGNYWSDYNGTDTNDDGIGDSPYIIDVLNQDRYPLMQILAVPPVNAQKTPVDFIILAIALIAIVAVAVIIYIKKRRLDSSEKESRGIQLR